MPSTWWKHDTLEAHIDQHRSAAGREFIVAAPTVINSPKWEDLRFPASGIDPPGAASDPARNTTTGLLEFSKSATNTIAGVAQMPHDWAVGTNLRAHVHWSGFTNPGANTDVVWKFDYEVVEINGTWDGSTYSNTATVTAEVTQNKHMLTSLDEIDMSDIDSVSCHIMWKLSRLGADGSDNYDAVATMFDIDFHYLRDVSSQEIASKSYSSDLLAYLTVPCTDNLLLRRVYVVALSSVDADASNYWTINIVQRQADGRYTYLCTLDNSVRGLTAHEMAAIPQDGNVDIELRKDLPVMAVCEKTGDPDPLDNLPVFLVLAQR